MTNRIEYILGLKPKTILSLRNGWLTQSSKDEIQLCKIHLPDNGEAMPERLAKAQDCNAMKHFLVAVTRSCFSQDK